MHLGYVIKLYIDMLWHTVSLFLGSVEYKSNKQTNNINYKVS